MKGLLFFLITLFSGVTYSQSTIDCIDLSRIPQRKVRNLLLHEKKSDKRYLKDFKPSCNDTARLEDYTIMENTYIINENPDNVWNTYKNTNFLEAWNGKIVSLGILFSKWTNQICYRDDKINTSIDTGQVFFIDLKLMLGLYNLPVGVQVLKIDSLLHSFTFSYLEGGKSKGLQTIRIFKSEDGLTKVIHTSAFKSDSRFRDRHLYPYFHTRILNEFHRNIVKSNLVAEHARVITSEGKL